MYIELQDGYFAFGRMTIKMFNFFKIDENANRPYEDDDRVHMSIRYEMNLDEHRIGRYVYGYLDWLGDLGGFNEGISWIVILVLSFCKWEPLQSYYVKRMFSYRDEEDQQSDSQRGNQSEL